MKAKYRLIETAVLGGFALILLIGLFLVLKMIFVSDVGVANDYLSEYAEIAVRQNSKIEDQEERIDMLSYVLEREAKL